MTYADQDFIPVEEQEEAPSYPTAFGITFTPTVSGVAVAILGLGVAAYLATQLVQPIWQQYQELKAQREDKRGQLEDLAKIKKQIEQKRVELDKAKQQNKRVLGLFANEESLDTLLGDLDRLIPKTNQKQRWQLTQFKPQQAGQADQNADGVINDGSLGSLVNGKLERRTFEIEMRGNFDQVLSTLRRLERLQSLLIVKDYKSEIIDDQGLVLRNPATNQWDPATFQKDDPKQTIPGYQEGVIPYGKPTIRTTFKLQALFPLTEEETKKQAEAAAAAATQPPAQQ